MWCSLTPVLPHSIFQLFFKLTWYCIFFDNSLTATNYFTVTVVTKGPLKERKNKIKIKGRNSLNWHYWNIVQVWSGISWSSCGSFSSKDPWISQPAGRLLLWTRMLVSCKKQWFKVMEPSTLLTYASLLFGSSPLFFISSCFSPSEHISYYGNIGVNVRKLSSEILIKSIYRMVWHLSHVLEI